MFPLPSSKCPTFRCSCSQYPRVALSYFIYMFYIVEVLVINKFTISRERLGIQNNNPRTRVSESYTSQNKASPCERGFQREFSLCQPKSLFSCCLSILVHVLSINDCIHKHENNSEVHYIIKPLL